MLRQCQGTLMKVCLYYTDRKPDSIRDLYQEIACNMWTAWPSFQGKSSLNTWVTRIALNVAGQGVRKRKRQAQFVDMDERFYDRLADEATDARYQRLYRLIDRLENEADRRLLFLYLDRHRLRDIAEMTGMTEAAVKQRIYRIKQKLSILNQQENEQ